MYTQKCTSTKITINCPKRRATRYTKRLYPVYAQAGGNSAIDNLMSQLSGTSVNKSLLIKTLENITNNTVITALDNELERVDSNLNNYTQIGTYKMLLAAYHANTQKHDIEGFLHNYRLDYVEKLYWLEHHSLTILEKKYIPYLSGSGNNNIIEEGIKKIKCLYLELRLCSLLSGPENWQDVDQWSSTIYVGDKIKDMGMYIADSLYKAELKNKGNENAQNMLVQGDSDVNKLEKEYSKIKRDIDEWSQEYKFDLKTDKTSQKEGCDIALAQELDNLIDEIITTAKRDAKEQSPGNINYANGLSLCYITSLVDDALIGSKVRQATVASKHIDVSNCDISVSPKLAKLLISAIAAVVSQGFSTILTTINTVLERSITDQLNVLFSQSRANVIDSLYRKECGCRNNKPAVMLITMLTYSASFRAGLMGFWRMKYDKGLAWDYREFYTTDGTTIQDIRRIKNLLISRQYKVSMERLGVLSDIVKNATQIRMY
jgi:hypothetical protein